jgi:hypothetical protein
MVWERWIHLYEYIELGRTAAGRMQYVVLLSSEFLGKGGMQTQAYSPLLPFYAAIVIFVCLNYF